MDDFTTSLGIEQYIEKGVTSLIRERVLPALTDAVNESIDSGWNRTLRTLLRLLCETGNRNAMRPC